MSPTALSKGSAFLVFYCFFTLYVSKAGLNLALVLLLIALLLSLFQPAKLKKHIIESPVYLAMYAVFGCGILVKALAPGHMTEVGTFFIKGGYLLLAPTLTITLLHKNNRQVGLIALIASACIGMLYSVYQFISMGPSSWNGTQITSFWSAIGTWSEIVAYFTVFLVPVATLHTNKKVSALAIALLALSITTLLLSGSRGPLLAIIVTCTLFMLINRRKTLIVTLIGIIITFSLLPNNPVLENTMKRVTSIANIETNTSNTARLVLWDNGLKFAKDNFTHSPQLFFLGTGVEALPELQRVYLEQFYDLDELSKSIGNHLALDNFHNAYIDNLNKMGLIYTLAYLMLIGYLAYYFWNHRKNQKVSAWSGLNLLCTHLIIGMFYSNQMEFETIALFFLLAMSLSGCMQSENQPESKQPKVVQ